MTLDVEKYLHHLDGMDISEAIEAYNRKIERRGIAIPRFGLGPAVAWIEDMQDALALVKETGRCPDSATIANDVYLLTKNV